MVQKVDYLANTVKRGLDEVTDEMKGGFKELMGEFEEVKEGLHEVKGGMKEGFDQIKVKLDQVAASTQDSLTRLKTLQAPNYLYPRLVTVKRVEAGGASSTTRGKRSLLRRLRGVGSKEMTLHFLCPVDMREVPCGHRGEGYRFRETRDWVKKFSPVLQVILTPSVMCATQ